MNDQLLQLLYQLEGVNQDPWFHPEGDALYHSLQVFSCALNDTRDVALLMAALLHDIGKAVDNEDHAIIGAEELDSMVPEHAVWLVRHHMGLLRAPRRTRRSLSTDTRLRDLEFLRRWDLQGRRPNAWVFSPRRAIRMIGNQLQTHRGAAANNHEQETYQK